MGDWEEITITKDLSAATYGADLIEIHSKQNEAYITVLPDELAALIAFLQKQQSRIEGLSLPQ